MSHMKSKNNCEMGEINFEKRAEEYPGESAAIANVILNEILENAMDIAINSNTGEKKMNIIDDLNQDEYNETCTEFKEIIEGLSKINVDNMKKPAIEEPVNLDVEMKRLLNEMMSPPFEIVNYENLPRKDGVGDQPSDASSPAERDEFVPSVKAVEKKSRITDLVMNSKKVLNNLLDEEERRRQEEWEVSNEHLIQVIELQTKSKKDQIKPENVPLPFDEDEGALMPKVVDELMDSVELSQPPLEAPKCGEGGDIKLEVQPKCSEEKKALPKKKKFFNFKFFASFKRNRRPSAPENN